MLKDLSKYDKNIHIVDGEITFDKQNIDLFYENNGSISLYINNNLQWNSYDETIYHEILVLPYMNYLKKQKRKKLNILVLGGGDGFVLRELKKFHKIIKSIDLVDFDEKILNLHKNNKEIIKLNDNGLNYKKLNIFIDDAFQYLKNNDLSKYDLIISDLVDPEDSFKTTDLYSPCFFKAIKKKMKKNAIFVTHLGSSFEYKMQEELQEIIDKNDYTNYKKTYFPIPTFGYYLFFSYINSKKISINEVLETKIKNKNNKFLNNQTLKAYLKFDKINFNKDK